MSRGVGQPALVTIQTCSTFMVIIPTGGCYRLEWTPCNILMMGITSVQLRAKIQAELLLLSVAPVSSRTCPSRWTTRSWRLRRRTPRRPSSRSPRSTSSSSRASQCSRSPYSPTPPATRRANVFLQLAQHHYDLTYLGGRLIRFQYCHTVQSGTSCSKVSTAEGQFWSVKTSKPSVTPLKLVKHAGGGGSCAGPAGGGGEGGAARRVPPHIEQRLPEHQEGQLFVYLHGTDLFVQKGCLHFSFIHYYKYA